MAINKKLIHFNRKKDFDDKVAKNDILDTSIVFIKDSKEIWTHGNLYKSVNWSELKMITFTVNDLEYTVKNGTTWGEFCIEPGHYFWVIDGIVRTDSGASVVLNGLPVKASDVIVSANYISVTSSWGGQ